MSRPRCVVVGAGRMAAGFVAPLLADAGWDVVLATRSPAVARACRGGIVLELAGARRSVDGVTATLVGTARFSELVLGADLVATSVGARALPEVGRLLAPALRLRALCRRPLNVLTVENHRHAPSLLADGLLAACPALAPALGRLIGIAGVAAWRAVSSRRAEPDRLELTGDAVDEAYADGCALVEAAPLDGSVPGLELVRSFDDRMVEKLWLFNAGHAAAAYHGWRRGHSTIAAAMDDPLVAAEVRAVLDEVAFAYGRHLDARPWAPPVPPRPADALLARYASRCLADPVARVAREPRRKLAADDRLVGPAVRCLDAGRVPAALLRVCSLALAYAASEEESLRRETALFGAAEVFGSVSGLGCDEELSHLVAATHEELEPERLAA